MQSTSNTYLSNLDHLRAFAAFMVFIWHFVHHPEGLQYQVHVPLISLLEQGYSGVALFMCISGYIFTYLTFGKHLHIGKFWFNRILRLFPLIIFWGLIETQGSFDLYKIVHPQGAWTIYIELQYYLALPVILFGISRFGVKILLGFLLALMAVRGFVWYQTGSVQELAYWTAWGRGDQFILGTMAFHLEQWIKRSYPEPKRLFALVGIVGFAGIVMLYQYVTWQGGYSQHGALSMNIIWVFLPAIEGACYCLMIIAYLQCRIPKWLDRPLSALGRWSYSIYLDHFQLVPFLYIFAVTRFGMGDDFYGRLAIATFIIFPMLVFFSAATYAIIEKPFLRLRRNYLVEERKNP